MTSSGNNRIAIQNMHSKAKPQANPTNKGKVHYFMEQKEEVGRDCSE